jgi:hypothetical protein
MAVESEYCGYFFLSSKEFRLHRLFACCLRLNRYVGNMLLFLSGLKQSMDRDLLSNLHLVYKFLSEKICETL